MKSVCLVASLSFTLALLLAAAPLASKNAESLARKIVARCVRIKDKDLVQISGGVTDAALMEDLAVEVARLGGDPLLTLVPSGPTARRLFLEVPAKLDSRTSPLGMKLAETVTALISIGDSPESSGLLVGVPGSRVQARQRAAAPIAKTLLRRNVRVVNLGNGMYPTEARARALGVSKAELTRQYAAGLDVDYDKLGETGERVRKVLAAGNKIRVTSPEGTDLSFRISRRAIFVSDGVISDEKQKRGGAACQAWLPAGETYTTVEPGSAEGKVVVERLLWEGKPIRGLSLIFKKGKMTEMKARSGLERLKENHAAGGAGRDDLSYLDIGINPAVKLPRESPGLYMEAGMITLGTGANAWAGGDNNSPFGLALFIRGGTLTVDEKVVVKGGKL